MKRKMKDSGIDWIGEIPEEWELTKLKFVTKNHYSGGTPLASNESLYNDEGDYFVNISDITNQRYLETTAKRITSDGVKDKNLKEVPKESILYAMYASVGKFSIAKVNCYISQAILSFIETELIAKGYLTYFLANIEDSMDFFSKGTTQMNLNAEVVKNFPVLLPPIPIQQKIASFLDQKCSEIDHILEKTRESIEEYKKLKQSIITEAVTKGLDRNVEMKESGIEWIGEIPRHWEVSKVKNELICFDYLREPVSADKRISVLSLYDYYGASGIIDRIDDYNVDDTVLLIGEDGANLLMRNLPLVYKASGKFWANNHAHILKPRENRNYDFFAYLLEAGDYTLYITGSAQPKLSQRNLMSFPIVRVPIEEQQAIATFLDQKCSEIDSLISQKQTLLTDLEAYKKSLIFECVTGKREVAHESR